LSDEHTYSVIEQSIEAFWHLMPSTVRWE